MKKVKLKEPKVVYDKQFEKWCVDYDILVDGVKKRKRPKFNSKKLAESGLRKIRNELKEKYEEPSRVLSPKEVEESKWMFLELEKLPFRHKSVRDVVEFYRDNYKEEQQTESVRKVVDYWIKKKKEELVKTSFNIFRSRFRNFKKEFGGYKIGELSSNDIIKYIETKPQKSQKKFFVMLGQFFNHISDKNNPNRFLMENPFNRVRFYFKGKFQKDNTTSPTILHYDEVVKVLKIAMTFKHDRGSEGDFLGLVVFGLFLGLRPSENENLSNIGESVWNSHIQLNRGVLNIDEVINKKTRDHRQIEIKPNVKKWLEYIRDNELLIYPNPYKKKLHYPHFKELVLGKKRSKDPSWYDVWRHTFTTWLFNSKDRDWYPTKKERSEGREVSMDYVLRQLGHSVQVNQEHYRGKLYDSDDTVKFWKLTPSVILKS